VIPASLTPAIPVTTGSTGLPAPPVEGVDPAGRPESVSVEAGRVGLVFLTGSCEPCRELWSGAVAGPVAIVTPNPATESRRRIGQLAPVGVKVVMSSEAWHSYGVKRAPWLVVVEDGVIVASGRAPRSWDAIDV
jgi:hypothetical protein